MQNMNTFHHKEVRFTPFSAILISVNRNVEFLAALLISV